MSELLRAPVTTVTNARSAAVGDLRKCNRAPLGRAPNPLAARVIGHARGGMLALSVGLTLLSSAAGCSSHGTPEQVAAACQHQLSVAKRDALVVRMRAAGRDPEAASERADLEESLRAALAEPEAQESLARCRSLYAELSSDRIACILSASDPVTINACTPQADRKRAASQK